MSTDCHDGPYSTGITQLRRGLRLASGGVLLLVFTVAAFAQSIPGSSHVILVIEENHSYNTVTNQNDSTNYMPWLVSTGATYGHATNYTTNSSGSLLDYLWLSSGSCHSDPTASNNACPASLPAGTHDFQCTGGGCPEIITDNNIFQLIDNAGLSWKVYAESLPSIGYMGGDSGEYAERHNPAKWYSTVASGSQAEKNKMVPFSQFSTDLANNALPTYSIIVPNLLDDAHDGTPQAADTWLQNNVAPVLNQSYFQSGGDGLLIITFDNGDSDIAGQVYTAVIGPKVTKGFVSNTAYQHPSTLATICASLGIAAGSCPGAGSTATAMADFFRGIGGGSSGVSISNPSNVPQIASPVPFQATATSKGLPITAMKVYLDGNPQEIATFNGNGSSSTLTAQSAFAMAAGTHTFNVNAWDTGGAIYQSQITFTVASSGMNIGAPGLQSQVTGVSPFTATATSNGLPITAMKVYLDFNPNPISTLNGNGTSQLTATGTYSFTNGPHVLIVNAWDNAGKVYQSAVAFNVSTSGMVIGTPGNGSQITGGLPFSAGVTSNGPFITAMKVYLDYSGTPLATYNGNNTNNLTVNTVYSIASGTHTLIVNAWDSGGQIYQSAVTFTVSSTGVVINTPASNSQVSSPVHFSATATSNGTVITAMNVYLDYNPTPIGSYNGNGTSTLTEQTSYSIGSGNHILIVNAWDGNGQIYQSAVSFTVQ